MDSDGEEMVDTQLPEPKAVEDIYHKAIQKCKIIPKKIAENK